MADFLGIPTNGGSNAFAALRQRCAEVLRETGQLRRIAPENLAQA